MKKRLTLLLTAIMMCVLAVSASAADNVAKIGDTEYVTLADAVAAVEFGETITLLANAGAVEIDPSTAFFIEVGEYSVANVTVATGNYTIYATTDDRGDFIVNGLAYTYGSTYSDGSLINSIYIEGKLADVVTQGKNYGYNTTVDSVNNYSYYGVELMGDTIMDADITLKTQNATSTSIQIPSGGIKLDLNGHTITQTGAGGSSIRCIYVQAGEELSVYDLSTAGDGKIIGVKMVVECTGGGTLNLYSGTITTTTGYYSGYDTANYAVYMRQGDTFNMYGGTIEIHDRGGVMMLTKTSYYDNNESYEAVEYMNFYGGTVYNSDTLDMGNGSAELNVYGEVTFVDGLNNSYTTTSGHPLVFNISEDGNMIIGDGKTLTNDGTVYVDGKITLGSDASIVNNGAFAYPELQGDDEFSGGVAYIAKDDGYYYYYATLEAAIADAADGDTVTILTDIALDSPIYIDKSITITGDADDKPYIAYASDHSYVFYITADDVTVEFTNLEMGVQYAGINVNSTAGTETVFGDTLVIIDNCDFIQVENTSSSYKFTEDSQNYSYAGYITYGGTTYGYDLKFTDNTITGIFSKPVHMELHEGNSVLIDGNVFNGEGTSKDKSSTLIVCAEDASITVTNNEFNDLYKAISIDLWEIKPATFVVEDNAFVDCTYSVDVRVENEHNQGIDLSENYYENNSTVSELVLLNSKSGSDAYGDGAVTDEMLEYANIILYPYYTTYTDGVLSDLYYGVASVTSGEDVTYYGSLAAAIAAAGDGDTVTLLDDITVTETITIPYGKDLIIDGDGHKITSTIDATGNAAGVFAVATDTTSTDGYRVIKSEFYDITFELCSKAPAISTGWYYYTVADLTVDGCTFLQADGSTVQWAIHSTSIGNLTLTNNVFDGNFTKALCFYSYLNESGSDWTINIKNNTFTGPEDTNTAAVMTLNLAREAVAGTVVNITGNTFENQKKVLSVDSCSVTGILNITGNKFINCLYGFDLSTDNDNSSDSDSTGNNMLEINTGYNLGYNYFVDSEGEVGYMKVLDSNSAVDAEYNYANNDTLSKLVFYPYYADSTLKTLVYEPAEDGSEVTKDVIDVAKETLTDTEATTEEKVDLVVTLDKDVIAEDTTLVDLVNDLDEALLAENGSLDANVSIATLSEADATAAAEAVEGIEASDLQVSEDATSEVKGLAVAVIGNETIPEGTTVTVTLEIAQTAASVIVETDDDTEETTTTIAVTYDIAPSKTVDDGTGEVTTPVSNDEISAPITFTLHLPSIFDDTNRATLTHKDGDTIYSEDVTYTVYHDGDDSYIKITTTHFSEFVVTYADKVSSGSSNIVTGVIGSVNGTTEDEEEVEDEEVADDIAFEDIDADAYYYDAVLWAVENGVTSGTSSTTFEPELVCNRAQAITFIWNAMGQPDSSIDNPFEDVAEGTWYYDAVLWGVENGIITGTSDTTFEPTENCSRAHIVTMLWRAAGEPEAETDNIFADVEADTWYTDAVLWAVDETITNGTDTDTFSPINDCTRGHIVTFLYRYMAE